MREFYVWSWFNTKGRLELGSLKSARRKNTQDKRVERRENAKSIGCQHYSIRSIIELNHPMNLNLN